MEYVHAYSCKQCMLSARVKSCQGLNRQCIIVAHCRLQSCKLNETENILIKDMTLLPSLSSLQAKLIFPTQNYIMLIPKKLVGVPFVSLNRAEYCRCMSQTRSRILSNIPETIYINSSLVLPLPPNNHGAGDFVANVFQQALFRNAFSWKGFQISLIYRS